MTAKRPGQRWLAPEVVQTSATDCGPASLKCLLEGFGISASYGRLREACQTSVDGTSIDTIEQVACQLGLRAEQVMLPADHLLDPAADVLPALVVTRHPNGFTHFVVVWRRHAGFVQVMDPGTGRRWLSCGKLLNELYVHGATIPAAEWRAWAESEAFLRILRGQCAHLGLSRSTASGLLATAVADPSWRSLAALEAAVRMSSAIIGSGALRRGREAARLVQSLFDRACSEENTGGILPESYWSVRPAPGVPFGGSQSALRMKGAVLVTVAGPRSAAPSLPSGVEAATPPAPLSAELAAALEEKPAHPGRALLGFLRADGVLTPAVALVALAAASGGVAVEALLLRVLFDLGGKLGVLEQRLGAVAALAVFSLALAFLEVPLATCLLRAGRRLETRLRLAFLAKIPRLGDRYFQSRLISDMADRSHSLQSLRFLPTLGGRFVRLIFELALTTAGLVWLDPAGAPLMLGAAAVAAVLPLLAQTGLTERDLRTRSHNAALGRHYLDALLGLVPIRAHGAERAVAREHEGLLVEWSRSSLGFLRALVGIEAVQALAGCALAAWLLLDHVSRSAENGAVLLLVYWALRLPALGQQIALIVQQYPMQRNVTLRALEPLGAPDETETECAAAGSGSGGDREAGAAAGGIAVVLEGVTARAGGRKILDGVNLRIAAGSRVAIVGKSGAGKSSLVGLMLGWHRPAAGRILVDGAPLDGPRLERLRAETAWVDPAVALWNRSLLDNLAYGAPADAPPQVRPALEAAELRGVLEQLPDGLQTPLGEGGALVSGGEGQRVRLGRALLRPDARLVILDEPFRGLDGERRRRLMGRVRQAWPEATLLCVTHDLAETLGFDRVLVVEDGRIVEDGAPLDLAERNDSRYRTLLEGAAAARTELWTHGYSRHLRLETGRLLDETGAEPAAGVSDAAVGPGDTAATGARHCIRVILPTPDRAESTPCTT